MDPIKGILNKAKQNDNFNNDDNHQSLVQEMDLIETLSTSERLHLAKCRRAQQLKVAKQKEKEWLKILKLNQKNNIPTNTHSKKNVNFENSVVLLEAASRNDIAEVEYLLTRENRISPNVCNEDGLTALHQCCIDNKVDMLKLLIENGANVNAEDSDKWTPLHAAATCGHLTLVKLLIAHGANLLAVNTDGNMPYDLCDEEECLDYIEYEMSERSITQELIDDIRSLTEKEMLNDLMHIANEGGDLEFTGKQGETPLHTACANGYVSVVEFLLNQHVNPDATDKDLWTPVHAAACWGHLEVLELLAQYGADLNMENKDGETPTDICEDLEIRERLETLKCEQESKKIADAQRRKVKRSQSNNTRAQSVRRTSLRDKTMTTKKDAVEEVRLRMRAQEVYSNLNKTDNISTTNDQTDSSSTISNPKFDSSKRTEPEGEANNTGTSEIVEDNTIISNSLKKSSSADNFSTDIFQSSKDNGKINVQVTVLVDTQNIESSISRTTLSNLKKHRLQYRNISLQSTEETSPQQENNSISFQSYDELVRLSKQNQYVNKFSGVAPDNTADYRKCCNIS